MTNVKQVTLIGKENVIHAEKFVELTEQYPKLPILINWHQKIYLKGPDNKYYEVDQPRHLV